MIGEVLGDQSQNNFRIKNNKFGRVIGNNITNRFAILCGQSQPSQSQLRNEL